MHFFWYTPRDEERGYGDGPVSRVEREGHFGFQQNSNGAGKGSFFLLSTILLPPLITTTPPQAVCQQCSDAFDRVLTIEILQAREKV